jgi:hypothetical protein
MIKGRKIFAGKDLSPPVTEGSENGEAGPYPPDILLLPMGDYFSVEPPSVFSYTRPT